MTIKEQEKQAKMIASENNGQMYYNFTQAAKIIGCSRNTIPALLRSAGVNVKRMGNQKMVSVQELVAAMAHRQVSATA